MNYKQTPNYTKYNGINKIGYILHGTMGSYLGAIEWLCNQKSKVSAHFVISKKGEITQLASLKDITWHCGNISNPTYRARLYLPRKSNLPKIIPTSKDNYENPNNFFVGIELELYEDEEPTNEQYEAIKEIVNQNKNIPKLFLCHKEIADYKSDFAKQGKLNMFPVQEIIRRCALL